MYRRVLGLLVAALAVVSFSGCQSADEATALSLLNGDRMTTGAAPLVEHPELTVKAQQWAGYLAANAGGHCSGAQLRHSVLSNGAPTGWRKLGENVGCRVSAGDMNSFLAPLQAGFWGSPGHKANIIDPTFNYGGIGLAAAPSVDAPGFIIVFEVQEFAAA